MGADTIYALSSGAGLAGVSVVRISGPHADALLTSLGVSPLPEARYAALHKLGGDGPAIDQALVLRFPAPGSFTGEDVAELHVHGGRAVLAAVFEAISGTGLARHAEPGEFTSWRPRPTPSGVWRCASMMGRWRISMRGGAPAWSI